MNRWYRWGINKYVCLFLAFFAMFIVVKAATADTSGNMIATIAGGVPGLLGDGGAATSAALYSPRSVAVDHSGNIYIADAEHYRIRKIDTSGIISTVAGNGTSGYSGDGGPATAAKLNMVLGVAVDSSGNIYIAEGHRIRKVNTSGVISTFAGNGIWGYSGDGGPATAAQLDGPTGVAVDASGNVYIADMGNNRVRKVNASGVITTFAGGGSSVPGDGGPATEASLGWPVGLAIDPSGNVYIADKAVDYIRKVNTSGVITTFAGNGTSGYSGDGGPATAAKLNLPEGVAVDSSGNVYIADNFNARVRKVNTSGVITTFAGNGTNGYSGDGGPATSAQILPEGVAVDNSGNILIADVANNRIRKVYAQPVPSAPTGVLAIGGNGRATVSFAAPTSNGGSPITFYTVTSVPDNITAISTGSPITVTGLTNGTSYSFMVTATNSAGTGPFSVASNSVTPSPIQTKTVAGNGTGGFSGDGAAAILAALNYPTDVAVDASGNIYIADKWNARIRKVDTLGIISTVAGNGTSGYSGDNGTATAAKLSQPQGVASDSAGNIYIADTANSCIRKVDTSGNISTVAGNGTSGYSGDNGTATAAKLSQPQGVASDSTGNIYIADTANSCIRKVDTSGDISTVAGNGTYGYSGDGGPATAAKLNSPTRVTVDRIGNIYIADTVNNRIRKVDTSGVISTVAGNGTLGYAGDGGLAISAKLSFPTGVAVDSLGNLYIADTANYSIRKVTTSGVINTIAGNGTYGYAGDNNAASAARFDYPTALALNPSGDLYIADSNNQRIREVFNAYTDTAYNLSIQINGSGTITNINPSGPTFSCNSASCVNQFNTGSAFILHATPSDGWTLSSLSSSVCSGSGDCAFNLSDNMTVSATFSPPMVKVIGLANSYDTIQAAYAAAISGAMTSFVMEAQAGAFNGPFNFGSPVDVTLKGGFDQAFSSNIGFNSNLLGILTIQYGSLTVENLVVK